MSTCATNWEQETDDVHRRYSLIEKEIRKESYVKYPDQGQKYKDMPSVHADVFSGGNYMLDFHPSMANSLLNGNKSVTFAEKTNDTARNQFRIATGGSYDNTNKSLTELTKTSSGTLAIALDEKVIDLIDKKTLEDPNITVTLKKTDSGQFTVDFNAEDSSTRDAYRVLVKRTPSGTRTLEVHENFINKLQAAYEIESEGNKKKESLDAAIDKKNKDNNKPAYSKNINNQNSLKSNKILNDNRKLVSDLMQEYDANRVVDVKVRGKNGSITEIKAHLTKTLSGNLAVDVHELSLLGNMSNNAKERAVVIKQSTAGSYDLDISRNNKSPNAVIRKTPSGGVLVVLTNPVLKSTEITDVLKPMPKEKFYTLKIKNSDCNVSDAPAVLKTTPSHNYLIVIDKEYEKGYKKVVADAVEDNAECYINITKTDSDNYLINFDDSDRCYKSNALVVKSPSGNIKIIKNSSTGNFQPRQSVDSGIKNFSEILSMLPQSSKVSSRRESQAARLSGIKSSSDSNLYQKVKMLTPDHTDLFKAPLAALKKSSSGQYAVVLGKESKKAFINNFKSYLQSNSQGLIPIKRTESGEITIMLNGDQKEKTHYGSLKITPSGNIYAMVDEEVVKGLEKDKISSVTSDTTEHSTLDTRSTHMIGKLKNPVNKAVTTYCNANPDSCGCDPSKCECKQLQCNAENWKQGVPEKEDGLRLFRPEISGIDWSKVKRNQDGSYKVCDPDKCTEQCCNNNTPNKENIKAKDNMTHIVIKPCACKPVLQRNPRAEEQCFYVVEAVCPYHRDRYDSVSNDLLEISGLCNKASDKKCFKNGKRVKTKSRILHNDNTSNWDSLHFLPPQLPAFLSEFKYR